MGENKVAILLSTYNGEKYLKAQLDSLLRQSVNADIFIRDDGSKDSSVSILQEYERKYGNFTVYYEENIGFVKSLFKLINTVNDKYLYYSFCDQDDIWMENKLEIAINVLYNYKDELAFYASSSLLVDDNLNIYGQTQIQHKEITIYNSLIQNIAPGHSQVITQKLFLLLNHDYNLNNIFCPDIWVTQIASVTSKVFFDNNPHTYYRQHSNNTLDYGKTKKSWVMNRIKRLRNDEIKKVCCQSAYFLSLYDKYLLEDQKSDIYLFIKYQKNIFTRAYFCFTNYKFYRQRKIENIYFKILYLSGCYKGINGDLS